VLGAKVKVPTPEGPVMLPIPGTSKVKHLEENVAAASLELTDEDLRLLNK